MIWFYRAKAWIWMADVLGLFAQKLNNLAKRCGKRAEAIVEHRRRGGF